MTARARELKGVLDQEGVEELVRRRLVPRGVEEEVRARLGNVSFCGGMGGLGSRLVGGGCGRDVYAVKKKNWK